MPWSILNYKDDVFFGKAIDDHELAMNDNANTSIAIGPRAAPLHIDKSIGENTYVGRGVAELAAAPSTYDQHNTAIGSGAMVANTGVRNSVLGFNALSAVSTAGSSAAVGFQILKYTTSFGNSALGYRAGSSIGSGTSNIAIGHMSIGVATSGQGTGDKNICNGTKPGKKTHNRKQ